MKALVCVSVAVVVLLAGVQSLSPPGGRGPAYMKLFVDYFLSEFCEDIVDTCRGNMRGCMVANKPEPIIQEEQLTALKNNLTACATDLGDTNVNFSDLTLESVQKQDEGSDIFDPAYGVSIDNIGPLVRCMMEKEGRFETIKNCITGA